MTAKRRRINRNARWSYARSVPADEFWTLIAGIYERRGVEFSIEDIAKKTHRKVEDLDGELDIATRHHIFVSAQWLVKITTESSKLKKTDVDPEGLAMSSLRERHEAFTGDNIEMLYWKEIVEERFEKQRKTSIRHCIRRKDTNKGFMLDNLYVTEVKADL